jgi:hypothetical protein
MKILKILKLLLPVILISTVFTDDTIVDITLPNFDVREKFLNCYNDGYSSTYNMITCYSNWPIQFSLILTDKICIKKGGSKKILSSMNINSCMKLNGAIQDCKTVTDFYKDNTSTMDVIKQTIRYLIFYKNTINSFFNNNGTQYLDENPYVILRDSEELPGHFPECKNYNSSVNYKVNPNYEILNESSKSDYLKIKKIIFEEGPVLAMIDSN